MGAVSKRIVCFLLVSMTFLPNSYATTLQPATDEPFEKLKVDYELQMNTLASLGEKIDHHYGNVQFEQVDLVVKGNGLPITVSRRFFSGAEYGAQNFTQFADWMLNLPSIYNTYL